MICLQNKRWGEHPLARILVLLADDRRPGERQICFERCTELFESFQLFSLMELERKNGKVTDMVSFKGLLEHG